LLLHDGTARGGGDLPRPLDEIEGLEGVARLEVLEALHLDVALEAGADLLDVVLEMLECRKLQLHAGQMSGNALLMSVLSKSLPLHSRGMSFALASA